MNPSSIRPVLAAGMLLGIGMGGFLDGIFFHQIFQAHNMLSAKLPPNNVVNLEVNMFWDGMFHLFTWITTAAGIAMLWRAAKRADAILSTRAFVGSLALGWGIFNLVEGVINHHILHLHHVREIEKHLVWDLAFLAFSAVLLAIGIYFVRTAMRRGNEPQPNQRCA
jgi:uncharacterized membrane protein